MYYKNGNIKAKGTFLDEKLHSINDTVCEFYNENGELIEKGFFEKGLLNLVQYDDLSYYSGDIKNGKASGKGTFIITSSNKRYYSENWINNSTEYFEDREDGKYKVKIILNKKSYKISEDKNCTICKSECCFGDWKNYSENKNWTVKSLGKNEYDRRKKTWNKKHSKI